MLGFDDGTVDLVEMKKVKSKDCVNRVPSKIHFIYFFNFFLIFIVT